MKRILKLTPLCLLIILLFVQNSKTRFYNEALSKGVEVKDSIDLKKTYGIVLKKSILENKQKQKKAEQDVKKANISNSNESSGPNYDVDPADGTDFQEVYKDSLFIGDSISNGLMYYKHLKPANVIADIGQSVRKTKNSMMKRIQDSNARYVYIMLGMNDSIGIDNADVFIKEYRELISEINRVLPKAKVAVISILPGDSTNKKTMRRVNNARIEAFNKGLSDLSAELGNPFIDLRPYLTAHPDFYEPDGLHLNRHFYRYWLKFIQVNYKEA